MKTFYMQLTDGGGDDGYGVKLIKEARVWEDNSEANHEISSITQGGNVTSSGGGLNCSDGAGGNSLILNGADWDTLDENSNGTAIRQLDPATAAESDWAWAVTEIKT